MSGGGIDVAIELNDAALDRALQRAISESADMRQPMGEIAEEWMVAVHERFDQEKDPLGAPWAKRWAGEDGKPVDPERKVLHLTGDLERAVVPDFGSDFAQVGVLRSGGPGKYARIHNEGGTIRPRHKQALSFGGRVVSQVVMPKRQFLGFGEAERRAVLDIMPGFLRGLFGTGLAGAGA